MKASKTEQITAATNLADTKSVELAEAQDKKATDKQDLVDTTATLGADTEFLQSLKEKCAAADAAYEDRQKVRSEELQAVSETIGILTDDEAQQAFSRSSSFIQMSMRTRRMSKRARAAQMLRKAGKKYASASLIQLAASVQADAFAKVKENIDIMVAELKKTQKEEEEKRDYCNSEIK